MARKKSNEALKEGGVSEEALTSSLPEKFEDFERAMKAKEGPVPEPEKPVEPGPFLPMEETKWSGIPMWRCLKCGETTFYKDVGETHTCKRIKTADEAEV